MNPIDLATTASVVAADLNAVGVTDVVGIDAREAYPHEIPSGSAATITVNVHARDAAVTDAIGERCGLRVHTYGDSEPVYSREGAVRLSNGSTVVLSVYGPTPQPRDVTSPSVAPAVTP